MSKQKCRRTLSDIDYEQSPAAVAERARIAAQIRRENNQALRDRDHIDAGPTGTDYDYRTWRFGDGLRLPQVSVMED